MIILKIFQSKWCLAFFAILTSVLISSRTFGQLSSKQVLELKDCISSDMVKLLFDSKSNSQSTKAFLIKVVVKNDAVLEKIELSDNLDSLFKTSFLKIINLVSLQKTIQSLAIKQQTLLIPVQYRYGKEESYNASIIKPETLPYLTFFNGVEMVGDCYWLTPIVTYRN